MSIPKLHRQTRATIQPLVCIPFEQYSKGMIYFPSNKHIMETSAKYWEADDDTFLKNVTYAINETINKFAIRHITGWQQLLAFSKYVYGLRAEFKANCTCGDFIDGIAEKLIWGIESSFVPERDDAGILSLIKSSFAEIKKQLGQADTIFSVHKTYVRFFAQTSIEELKRLVKVAGFQMKKRGETKVATILDTLFTQLNKFEVQL